MNKCGSCGASNEEDERRCRRCGRRLQFANARPAPVLYPLTTATAPAIHRVPDAFARAAPAPAEPQSARRRQPIQPSLFSSRELPQVIPFESIAPERGQRKRPVATFGKAPARRAEPARQGSLNFVAAEQTRQVRSSPEAVIYCAAPVAAPLHRVMASAIDITVVLVACALFLATYHFAGGAFPQGKHAWTIFGIMAGLLYFFYEAIWCVACGDTPGMRSVHLRVLDFDGREPSFRQRMIRLGGSVLSILAVGVGLIWALSDEENLTWHDHMSNTFPTYADPTRR